MINREAGHYASSEKKPGINKVKIHQDKWWNISG
jgi:hypothetical protein